MRHNIYKSLFPGNVLLGLEFRTTGMSLAIVLYILGLDITTQNFSKLLSLLTRIGKTVINRRFLMNVSSLATTMLTLIMLTLRPHSIQPDQKFQYRAGTGSSVYRPVVYRLSCNQADHRAPASELKHMAADLKMAALCLLLFFSSLPLLAVADCDCEAGEEEQDKAGALSSRSSLSSASWWPVRRAAPSRRSDGGSRLSTRTETSSSP
jgi:hypothetical protein